LIEDAVWRWSSAPDRYLDTALRLAFTGSTDVRLVDAADAPVLAVTLLAWQLEGQPDVRLLGAIEVRLTGMNRVIRSQIIRDSERVSGSLPGNLSVAAGRLLGRLASETSKRVATESSLAASTTSP
jgi:hypothetical protein